jgi:hypothetical protein
LISPSKKSSLTSSFTTNLSLTVEKYWKFIIWLCMYSTFLPVDFSHTTLDTVKQMNPRTSNVNVYRKLECYNYTYIGTMVKCC